GLPGNWVWTVEPDASGGVWFGTKNAGAVRYDGRQFQRYTAADGPADDDVSAILPTPEGIVWFGTESGLSRFDGQTYTNFTRAKHQLAYNRGDGIMLDGEGVLWSGGSAGVTRYDGHVWSTLSELDGVGGNRVVLHFQDEDGAFWL